MNKGLAFLAFFMYGEGLPHLESGNSPHKDLGKIFSP